MIKIIDNYIVKKCTYHSNAHFEKEDYQSNYSKNGWVAINDFHILFDEYEKRLGTNCILDTKYIIHGKDEDKVNLSEEDRKQIEELKRKDKVLKNSIEREHNMFKI